MRLAWFRPDAGPARQGDDTALLLEAARARHAVEVVTAAAAHDFVWRQARDPADLCVFELGRSQAHRFAAAYAIHFPGLAIVRSLAGHGRAIGASRLAVVAHDSIARLLADDGSAARVRTLTPGVEPLPPDAPAVVEAIRWPVDGEAFTDAMAGFAAGRAVVVPECIATAGWPALDPQSWRPRTRAGSDDPICVSVDVRDEAHSLRLARRRLADDAALRARLGAAAHAWWRAHATPAQAAAGFERLLDEARALEPPAFDADWGGRLTGAILAEFGITRAPW